MTTAEWGFLDGYHGSVHVVPSMVHEPTPGLLTNTYTSAQQLLAELTAEQDAWLLTTPLATFSDAEQQRYSQRYAQLLGLHRMYAGSSHTKLLADWQDTLAGCCTEVERSHVEHFEYAGRRIHAVLVHMGPGLAAYVLLYETAGVELGLHAIIAILSEERLGAPPADAAGPPPPELMSI